MSNIPPYRPAAGSHALSPHRQPLTALTCLAVALLLAVPAQAEHFTPPDLEGFTQHTTREADGDGDGVNETHIVTYVNAQNDSLFSMSTKGQVWAWSLDTHDSDLGSSDYVIRDSDCDGTFDEVYGLDDEFHVPDCLE